MPKVNISATVDEEVEAFLSQEHVNASGLINDLVRRYMHGGDEKGAMLRLREEQLRSEIEALSQQLGTKEQELDRITESREQAESGPDMSDELDDVLDTMEQDGAHVYVGSQTARDLAGEYGLSNDDVVGELKARAASQERDILDTQFERADMVRGQSGKPIGEVYDDE